MKLQTVFSACNHILKLKLINNPDAKTRADDGTIVSCKELSDELENLESWCYKGELEVQKIVRCKSCKHYKRYKKKTGGKKPLVIVACELDKLKKDSEFYCARGEERE